MARLVGFEFGPELRSTDSVHITFCLSFAVANLDPSESWSVIDKESKQSVQMTATYFREKRSNEYKPAALNRVALGLETLLAESL